MESFIFSFYGTLHFGNLFPTFQLNQADQSNIDLRALISFNLSVNVNRLFDVEIFTKTMRVLLKNPENLYSDLFYNNYNLATFHLPLCSP